jgi:hypothetical protein
MKLTVTLVTALLLAPLAALHAVEARKPNIIILLVDERPEEVTEIRRSVPSAQLLASSNDSDIKTHTRISQLAIERAKRLEVTDDSTYGLAGEVVKEIRTATRNADEERKKIKRVDSEHHRRREIRNWKKVWSEHTNDYDEVDEFYGQR